MNRDYAAKYRHLYMHHWWWRAREQAVLRVLRERLRAGRRERILDIGCGDAIAVRQTGSSLATWKVWRSAAS